MGSKYQHGNRGSTKRKWRWNDRTENRAFPQSWADNGRTEAPEDGEIELYAIQWRAGLLLEWVINIRTGKLVKGPLREQPGIRVLYVTADGDRGMVQEWQARETDGRLKPPTEFASIVAKSSEKTDAVQDSDQDYYRRSVDVLYDVE
ncbi:hypothetical protein Harman_38630 [Haloarcula mannanilytica]|uniref:Uncharacterized protein n=1 Tax=Haloarcula mannanilytica TaxID=2509225 RepID=A0A4C2EMW1_9EURY|nr:hypothetical protein Harman_38630 [Haloarcula mannanilytica]